MILGRVIQGVGSGIIIPLLTTLIVRSAGAENLGSVMSIVSIPTVLATILGPTFGGFIVKSLNWRWIFYINVPIVIFSALLIIFALPNFESNKNGKKLDMLSIVFLGISNKAILIAQGGLTIPVMSDSYINVPKELISEATTATRMLQSIGGAIGTAILAAVIQHTIGSQTPTQDLLLTSYHNAFIFTVISLVLALIPSFFLTNNRNK